MEGADCLVMNWGPIKSGGDKHTYAYGGDVRGDVRTKGREI